MPKSYGTHTPRRMEGSPWWARAAAGRRPGPGRSPSGSSAARPLSCHGPRASGAFRSRMSRRGTPRLPRPRPLHFLLPRTPAPVARRHESAQYSNRELALARAQPCCSANHVIRLVTWPAWLQVVVLAELRNRLKMFPGSLIWTL